MLDGRHGRENSVSARTFDPDARSVPLLPHGNLGMRRCRRSPTAGRRGISRRGRQQRYRLNRRKRKFISSTKLKWTLSRPSTNRCPHHEIVVENFRIYDCTEAGGNEKKTNRSKMTFVYFYDKQYLPMYSKMYR
jgi:hypothetical protein